MWSPEIWLPHNTSWHQFQGDPQFAQFSHLGRQPTLLSAIVELHCTAVYPLPLALLLLLLRRLLDGVVFRPLGKLLGIKESISTNMLSTNQIAVAEWLAVHCWND